jgi:hypothetical protein
MKPKLLIFSFNKKNAKIAANIGSKEYIIPALVGVISF